VIAAEKSPNIVTEQLQFGGFCRAIAAQLGRSNLRQGTILDSVTMFVLSKDSGHPKIATTLS
jgi:hypothetical protein